MRLSRSDKLLLNFDKALRILAGAPRSSRPRPGSQEPVPELTARERRHAAALMRVNHAGEVCAQGLYQAQALGARAERTERVLRQAALEEEDHLAWSAERIAELGGRPSLLTPLWYAGSLAIGIASAALGDRWNLAFLAETERQVAEHLAGHMDRLPAADRRTRSLVAAMRTEEIQHRETALRLGAAQMPRAGRLAMRWMAKVMTTTSYRL